jgi:hypothetical protein
MVLASPVGAALLVTAGAAAQTFEFVPIAGGAVSDLAYDPHTPGLVFAAVHGVGIYKSTDAGTTFAARALPEVRAHSPRQVLPSNAEAGIVLVCEPNLDSSSSKANNVFRSADGGETFAAVLSMGDNGCTALAESRTAGTYFAASGTTPKVVLYRSTDSGATWEKSALTNPNTFASGRGIASFVELPSGRLVFALASGPDFGTVGSGALAYSDDGATLTPVTGPQFAVPDIAFNGTDTLLAFEAETGDPYLWQSADGATFSRASFADGAGAYSPYQKLRYVPARDTYLSLTSDRVLQSTTHADSYKFSGNPIGGVGSPNQVTYFTTMAADPDDANGFLLGEAPGGYGVVRGQGNPRTWAVAAGIAAARLDFALYDATTGYQYLASAAGRVFFADAGAARARQVFRGKFSDYEPVTAMAYDLADSKRIVLGTRYGDGVSEQPRLLELSDAVAAPNDSGDGQHAAWTRSVDPMPPMDGDSITALIIDGMTRYVGYTGAYNSTAGERLYRSRDGGATYEQLPLRTDQGVSVLVRDPTNPDVLYAGGGGDFTQAEAGTRGLFKSTDAGDSWTQVAPDPKLANLHVSRIALDPDHPDHLWMAAGNGSALWQTLDGGTTFTDITPVSGSSLTDITYSASLGSLVLALENGVFTRDPNTAALTSLTDLYGQPLALYPDARGIATSAGLYVASDLLGMAGAGGASEAGGSSGEGAGTGGRAGTNDKGGSANSGASQGVGGSVSIGGSSGRAGSAASGAGRAGASGGRTSGTSEENTGGSTTKKTSGCACHVGRCDSDGGGALFLALLGLMRVRRRGSRSRPSTDSARGASSGAKPQCGD